MTRLEPAGRPGESRYYNDVSAVRTTRYCSQQVRRRSRWWPLPFLILWSLAPAATARAQPAPPVPFFPLTVAWDTGLGATPAARPAFASGSAFVALRDRTLVAVDLETGQLRWRVPVAATIAPAADDEFVYAYAGDALVAFARDTGELQWEVALRTAPTAPMVARAGWLFVPAEGHLLAINGRSGALVWRRDFDSRMGVRPVVDGDRLALGFDDGQVVLVDVTTGATLWAQRLGGAVSGLHMDAERVYAGSRDRFFYCLQTSNGRMAWRWRTGGDVVGAALVDERHVYFVSLDNLMRALDRRHGAQRWHKPIKSRPLGGPVIAGDAVIVAGLTPEVHGFARRDGAPLGPLRTAAEIAAPPHVHPRPLDRGGDLLVVLLADGRLVAARRRIEPPVVPLVVVPGVPVTLTPPPGWSPPAS